MRQFGGYLLAIASGAFYGIISVIILFISRFGAVPSLFCMMVRMFFAGVLLLPFALPRLRAHRPTPQFLRRMFLAGVILSSSSILIYTALDTLPAGIGISLHYTYPLFVTLLSVLLFRTRVTRRTVTALLLSLAGIVLLCDSTVLPGNALGAVCLAILSAVAFAAYYLWIERKKLGEMDSVLFTMLLSFFDSFVLMVYNLSSGQLLVSVNINAVLLLIAAGLFAMLAVLTQVMAVERIGSVMTSILGTFQPIVCTLGSVVVLHDVLSARSLFGSALILAAVVIITLGGRKKE